MRTGTLDRYILREFAGPFLLGVLGISLILASGLLFELANFLIVKKVALPVVGHLLLYRLPWVLVQALPVAALFGGLLAIWRLNKDSELVVIRGGGVSLRRTMAPLLAVAALLSVAAYFTNEMVVPWTNHEFENTIRRIIFGETGPEIQENIFFRGSETDYFYIRRFERAKMAMRDVMVYRVKPEGLPVMITAPRAEYRNRRWHLKDGVMRELDREGFVTNEARFADLEIIASRDVEPFFGEQRTTDEMSRSELRKNIELFEPSGIDVNPFLADYHLKLAMPFANLVFVLFGLSLALAARRGRGAMGIAASVAATSSYYVITPFFRSLGASGVLPPLAAAWLPTLILGLAGVLLLWKMEAL